MEVCGLKNAGGRNREKTLNETQVPSEALSPKLDITAELLRNVLYGRSEVNSTLNIHPAYTGLIKLYLFSCIHIIHAEKWVLEISKQEF